MRYLVRASASLRGWLVLTPPPRRSRVPRVLYSGSRLSLSQVRIQVVPLVSPLRRTCPSSGVDAKQSLKMRTFLSAHACALVRVLLRPLLCPAPLLRLRGSALLRPVTKCGSLHPAFALLCSCFALLCLSVALCRLCLGLPRPAACSWTRSSCARCPTSTSSSRRP